MERIAIMGAGLSGLLSAYRIRGVGSADTITIYEKNLNLSENKTNAGAFYCYEFFNEELTPESKSFDVHWVIKSLKEYGIAKNRKNYAEKIYGKDFDRKVSIAEKQDKGYWIDTARLLKSLMVDANSTNANMEYCTTGVLFDRDVIEVNTDKREIMFSDATTAGYDTLINTMPLPMLIQKINNSRIRHEKKKFMDPSFKMKPIHLSIVDDEYIGDDMIIEYLPDLNTKPYRKTYYDNQIRTESMIEFGNSFKIFPGKIFDNFLQKEINEELNNMGIYNQGRYARWEAKYFVHHVWNSVLEEVYGIFEVDMGGRGGEVEGELIEQNRLACIKDMDKLA